MMERAELPSKVLMREGIGQASIRSRRHGSLARQQEGVRDLKGRAS